MIHPTPILTWNMNINISYSSWSTKFQGGIPIQSYTIKPTSSFRFEGRMCLQPKDFGGIDFAHRSSWGKHTLDMSQWSYVEVPFTYEIPHFFVDCWTKKTWYMLVISISMCFVLCFLDPVVVHGNETIPKLVLGQQSSLNLTFDMGPTRSDLRQVFCTFQLNVGFRSWVLHYTNPETLLGDQEDLIFSHLTHMWRASFLFKRLLFGDLPPVQSPNMSIHGMQKKDKTA